MADYTVGEWVDALGQTYRPGDIVAVATISGRSPQLVITRVERINTHNSKGEPHVKGEWALKEGADEERDGWRDSHEWVEKPTVTVTATPVKDARGFYRSKNPRAVTYSIPENIIKVDGSLL